MNNRDFKRIKGDGIIGVRGKTIPISPLTPILISPLTPILTFFLLLGVSASAESADWIEPTTYKEDNVAISQISEYVSTFETAPGDQFLIWRYDFNGDLMPDYFVSSLVRGYCGTAGCASTLFISQGEKYKVVNSPHIAAYQNRVRW